MTIWGYFNFLWSSDVCLNKAHFTKNLWPEFDNIQIIVINQKKKKKTFSYKIKKNVLTSFSRLRLDIFSFHYFKWNFNEAFSFMNSLKSIKCRPQYILSFKIWSFLKNIIIKEKYFKKALWIYRISLTRWYSYFEQTV